MSLNELFFAAYAWAERYAAQLFAACLLLPLVGALLCSRARRGGTATAVALSNLVAVTALAALVVELLTGAVGVGVLHRSLLEANVLLVTGPVLGLVAALVGLRLVMPLHEVPSLRFLAGAA